jgi:putative transposase
LVPSIELTISLRRIVKRYDGHVNARSDIDLLARIRSIHVRSHGTYGMTRIHGELVQQGLHVGRNRVARLMRIAGLCGVSRRRWIITTRRQPDARPAPDLVQRHFSADAPDRLWVADATYVPTGEGFLYLAVVLDVFSRRTVGWSMSSNLYTELILRALDIALAQRRPEGVIHYSDQGCQYTSIAFGRRCREAGVRLSMGAAFDISRPEAAPHDSFDQTAGSIQGGGAGIRPPRYETNEHFIELKRSRQARRLGSKW